ncbi:hypothetical protein Q9Q99_02995 [Curtobacterium flaccumfaciens]|nr:hypothetical protein Q9Q99_02995 [Curtobacterium flaccumfaciens]
MANADSDAADTVPRHRPTRPTDPPHPGGRNCSAPPRTTLLAALAAVAVVGLVVAGVAAPGSVQPASAAPMWPVPQPYPVPDDPAESLADLPPGSGVRRAR